ncbi:hypothetical protein TCAL_01060 [Tigriopus californicus]|uniref:CTLH domain-containing protein n=1 Tax=Tigriopus californicus TaxID=6832 RepID=A0A553P490_TIGCA|nr:WD repeat-containing protein 47-like [Tigriopus californicus]XP_059087765.1 WD repeat-containing protein 47-like [Tigriopus californicus]XP_059087766.1 WD repeat-containing protein 47-like [Tigriopus californicus]XP_059087767.1 WD repeat-containing protein 47-like [Tigriopus californicus]XP_059087768.1 WD repeat-containing protein 47-like [Tigriopus californicus]TRY72507.1 hypothetical protein TCAL_01060 [Tigriopus californicus]|eukprot:TCALIF_01060-PA protein Name:"Similar to WDR47 WD repeat-containing protein 47 (Homo sapiens)" AED:0.13 eAED:0.18 QI:0/-1/0/1/-1/1/1/0/755
MAASMSSSGTHLTLKEEDVIKLASEFLQNRLLHISQVMLERESGVINGNYSDDTLFLRQLILDGQWDDIMEFIQPLASLPSFDFKLFQFLILKAKFVELLCIKSEAPDVPHENAVNTVVDVLKEIEQVAPSKEHYSNLCLLLTMNKLSDHAEYKNWNPTKGRINCFKAVLPLIVDLLGGEKDKQKRVLGEESCVATNDRLLQLIIKGILYESCVDYCQQKATGAKQSNSIDFTNILSQSDFNDSDLSLLSWLQSIPPDTFACPFEQKSLNVDVERIKAPTLETKWTEYMLITPIKPNIFPHSAMPSSRPKGADVMTKSLSVSIMRPNGENGVTDMTKSLAGFHLNSKKMMDSSVDHLFKDGESNRSVSKPKPPPPPPPPVPSKPKMIPPDGHHTPQLISSHEPTMSQAPSQMKVAMGKKQLVGGPPRFLPASSLEDVQAIRCAEFHPGGRVFAVGSNSKILRLCQYPDMSNILEDHETTEITVLSKRPKHHKGSIYCLAWNSTGELIATGSNDKTVKVVRFNNDNRSMEPQATGEIELNMHDGTVRDVIFMLDHPATLISGGAGDCKIQITDCNTGQNIHSMMGHSGHVLSLCTWGGPLFASGSQDKTVRFWDLRTHGCINMVQFHGGVGGPPLGSPVAACSVDPSGRLLVTGHEDATCCLYDVRGGRSVQAFNPHNQDIRSVRFSPNAYYLLTGGYDNRLILTDLQGDLSQPLPSVVVAQHQDKVISGRWHPTDFSFLSTSADKTCTLWGLPPI